MTQILLLYHCLNLFRMLFFKFDCPRHLSGYSSSNSFNLIPLSYLSYSKNSWRKLCKVNNTLKLPQSLQELYVKDFQKTFNTHSPILVVIMQLGFMKLKKKNNRINLKNVSSNEAFSNLTQNVFKKLSVLFNVYFW